MTPQPVATTASPPGAGADSGSGAVSPVESGSPVASGSTVESGSAVKSAAGSSLRSGEDSPFQVVTDQGQRYIVGHAIAMRMPASWVTYGSEKLSADGTSYEWASGLPEGTKPLPAGVQFSMGVADKGAQIDTLPQNAKQMAESAPGYKFLDEGDAQIQGATTAKFLRFERDLTLDSGTIHVEQLALFLQVKDGVTSTIRFIAASGDWDKQMNAAYKAVQVRGEG